MEAVTIIVKYEAQVDGCDEATAKQLWRDAMTREAEELADRHGAEVEVHYEDMLQRDDADDRPRYEADEEMLPVDPPLSAEWSKPKNTVREKLTTRDLIRTLEDDRHLGWGYATRSYLSESKRERLDRAVVAVANEMGLDYEGLFEWSNSKNGRWLVDAASGETPTQRLVRDYLNGEAMRVLAEGR